MTPYMFRELFKTEALDADQHQNTLSNYRSYGAYYDKMCGCGCGQVSGFGTVL
jgi:hypothetical protein